MELTNRINEEISKVSETAQYLWEKGWAERNGGNISIDLTELFFSYNFQDVSDFPFYPEPNLPEETKKSYFFFTGTGKRLRELKDPENAACIIHIDDKAEGYSIIWGGSNNKNFKPTSEFPTHIKIHMQNRKFKNKHTAVVHTHPTELIALSHYKKLKLNNTKLSQILWSMLPEVRAFVPRGIATIPYALPGSENLAELTTLALKDYDVALWLKHGAIASGKDALEAFDFIDVANKGATIYLKCLSCGFTPEGLSQIEMEELEKKFNL